VSETRRLWIGLAVLLVASFGVLLGAGVSISNNAPPVPDRLVSEDGKVLYSRADIEKGRVVWQSMGGMQLGSIWGHGGYVAPDWSADWLHREATAILDIWARKEGTAESYAALSEERQAALRGGWKRVGRHRSSSARCGPLVIRVALTSNQFQ
jgi:nitric oxide reductase subunit B